MHVCVCMCRLGSVGRGEGDLQKPLQGEKSTGNLSHIKKQMNCVSKIEVSPFWVEFETDEEKDETHAIMQRGLHFITFPLYIHLNNFFFNL